MSSDKCIHLLKLNSCLSNLSTKCHQQVSVPHMLFLSKSPPTFLQKKSLFFVLFCFFFPLPWTGFAFMELSFACSRSSYKWNPTGVPGWLSLLSDQLWTVRELQPRIGLCADSSELGACLGFCVSLSLCPFPAHALSLLVSQKWINIKRKFINGILPFHTFT